MARARKYKNKPEEEAKPSRRGLEPAYGQPGQNKYVIYADMTRDDMTIPKVLILNFKAKYAAKFFLDRLIEEDSWSECEPVGSRTGILVGSAGLRITMFGDDIWDLLKYEPTEAESEWEDDQVRRHVQRFKYGRAENLHAKASNEDNSGVVETRDRKVRDKQPKPERVKIDKTGLISANEIAAELKCEGREVRGVLRSMKMEKPAGGWLFDKKTADEIKEKVKKALKKK